MDLFNASNQWVGMAQPQGQINYHLWAYIYDDEPTTHYPHVQIMTKIDDGGYKKGNKDRVGRGLKTICTIRLNTEDVYDRGNLVYESKGSAWHTDLNHEDLKDVLVWLNGARDFKVKKTGDVIRQELTVSPKLWEDYRLNNKPSINYDFLTHIFIELDDDEEGEEKEYWEEFMVDWCKEQGTDFGELYEEWEEKWEKKQGKGRR